MYCKNFQAVLKTVDKNGNYLVTRTRCKRWTCSYCAMRNRSVWNARLIDHINKTGGKWCWFTLTAHSKARGASKSVNNLREAWDKLIKRMKRKFGKFDYCRVYEPHADGSYHAHVIASFHFGDIVQRKSKNNKNVNYSKWLAKTAKELKLGYYTHADDIKSDMHGGYVASYITKYIVKLTPEQHKEIGRIRHIQTSQGWAKLNVETEYKWEVKTGIYVNDMIEAFEENKSIMDINTGEKITWDDFTDNYVYPPEFNSDAIMLKYTRQEKVNSID